MAVSSSRSLLAVHHADLGSLSSSMRDFLSTSRAFLPFFAGCRCEVPLRFSGSPTHRKTWLYSQWISPLKYTLEALAVNEVASGLLIQDTLAGVKVEISAAIIMQTLFGFTPTAYYRFVPFSAPGTTAHPREQGCSRTLRVRRRFRFAVGSCCHLQVEGEALDQVNSWGNGVGSRRENEERRVDPINNKKLN